MAKKHLYPTVSQSLEGTNSPRVAASYARKSNPDDVAVEDQHRANRQRAERDGWTIPQAYCYDDDNTRGHLTSRAGLDTLNKLIETGTAPFARVYVRHRDRLARVKDPRYIFYIEYGWQKHGVQVCYSSTQGDHVQYQNMSGGNAIGAFITDAVENVRTSEEVRILGERINTGLRSKIVRGEWPAAWIPYGTERWLVDSQTRVFLQKIPHGMSVRQANATFRLRWDSELVPVVKQIYDGLEDGSSLRAVARKLKDQGVPCPGARRTGGVSEYSWLARDVWAIARDPLYKGDLVWGRSAHRDKGAPASYATADLQARGAIEYPGYLPDAPITAEQWQTVQNILNGNVVTQRKRRASTPAYLLTGLVVCESCGELFSGHTSPREVEGERRRYYRHFISRRQDAAPCRFSQRYIPALALEQVALDVVSHSLSEGTLVKMVKEEVARSLADTSAVARETEAAGLRKLIGRLTRGLDNATGLASMADTDAERQSFTEQAKRFGQELMAARAHLAQIESTSEQLRKIEGKLLDVERWVERFQPLFETGAASDRKRVVAAVVEAVRLNLDTDAVEIRVRTAPQAA